MSELAYDLSPPDDVDRLLQAEALVRSYCGWHIAPSRTETVTLAGSDSRTLILPSLYVTDVASVTTYGGEVVPVESYDWTSAGVISRGWRVWDCRPVTVVFTHGYAEPPADVTSVVQAIARRAVAAPDGRTIVQVGQVRYSDRSTDDRDTEAATLDRYRLPRLA